MRKLASIQRIWKIEPIEGADRIELAHVLGWQCVVNKGQFQEMDLAVYFEVDSFLPIAPEFEFLRVSSYRKTDIMGVGTKEMPENVRDSQVPDFVQEAEAQMAKDAQAPKREEVTIKFGKGLAEPFQSKDGREFMRIMIPNQDQSDKTPWASFVMPAKAVHENQYGKGLWAKIPADGTTIVSKPVLKGQDEQGKNIWDDQKTKVPNSELKGMVEAYKTRAPQEKSAQPKESAREKLDALVKDTASKVAVDKPKAKTKSKKGPEL